MRAHLAQHLVAHFVPKGVVDDLEVVEVKHHHLERPVIAPRSRSFLVETQGHVTRVGQAGQRIGQRIRFRLRVLRRIRQGVGSQPA